MEMNKAEKFEQHTCKSCGFEKLQHVQSRVVGGGSAVSFSATGLGHVCPKCKTELPDYPRWFITDEDGKRIEELPPTSATSP